jgi:glucose/arabinose dehydrogenase
VPWSASTARGTARRRGRRRSRSFAWRDGTLGPQQTLLTGFQAADGSRWGRPVMAVQGPDKAIYVSDDSAGAVYRVTAS